jgi:hypothetical protein
MPDLNVKTNQLNAHKAINYKDLLVNPSPENICIVEHRPHVTLRWISCRFKVTYSLLSGVIADIEQDMSWAQPVTDVDIWIDDAAFVEICNHPLLANTFSAAQRDAVLHLLGHYQRVAA